jgi:hypothetical protein
MADVKEKGEEQAGLKPEGAGSPALEAAGGGAEGAARPTRQPRVRAGRVVPFGIVHIRATFNNTIISISDSKGGVVAWSTSGRAGFKGRGRARLLPPAWWLRKRLARRYRVACRKWKCEFRGLEQVVSPLSAPFSLRD